MGNAGNGGREPESLCRLTLKRLERVENVAKLWLSGHSLRDIAEIVGKSLAQIRRDLEHARAIWAKSLKENLDFLLNRELSRLDTLEAEAWRAWRESRRDQTSTSYSKTKSPDGTTVQKGKRVSKTAGEAPFMGIILECIKTRLKIIEFARASEVGDGDDIVVEAVEVVVRSREEAQRMLEFEQFRKMIGDEE